MKNSFVDLMSDLNASTQENCWIHATQFFGKFGFHITTYGILDKNTGNILGFHSNMADDWMAYYMTQDYRLDDPWAQYIVGNDTPVLYSREGESELIVKKGSLGEAMMDDVSHYGLNNSICIPIHNKFGDVNTGFNLGSDMNHAEFKAMIAEYKEDILLGAALINNNLAATSPTDCDMPSWFVNPHMKNLLSERELEVLKWLSEGNRNDRIAEKMNIASVTVNFHLKEIKRKLGARTREQAVALAFKQGLLK